MYKNILLTVDLNHPASWAKAMPLAVEMARVSGGTIHVMSVVPEFGMPLVEEYFPADYKEQALTRSKDAMEKLVAEGIPKDISVKQHLAYGEIHRKVLDAIESTGCDLVIMASHAPDRVREFLVGSNADRVVRRSPVSVLVVRG
jgi:nucleotide-binding universal stress UspA family protein